MRHPVMYINMMEYLVHSIFFASIEIFHAYIVICFLLKLTSKGWNLFLIWVLTCINTMDVVYFYSFLNFFEYFDFTNFFIYLFQVGLPQQPIHIVRNTFLRLPPPKSANFWSSLQDTQIVANLTFSIRATADLPRCIWKISKKIVDKSSKPTKA